MSAQPREAAAPTFAITVFRDIYAKTFTASSLSMEQLVALVQSPTAANKKDLPLLKGAIFGNVLSNDGSLRHDLNVLEVSGVEIDYDGEVLPFEAAAERLRVAKIECVMYTSPSYTVEKPRYRIVARLSVPIKPTRKMKPEQRANMLRAARAKYVRRLDAVLGFVAANESYALSQSYFLGSIKDGSSVDVRMIEGRCIDKCKELDKIARPKAAKPKVTTPAVIGKRPYRADMSDQQILDDYAYPSKNGDRLKRLLSGDISGYPSSSEADLACASDLAFWFWRDAVSIENVMRDSSLFREKWDTNKKYLERTIAKALTGESNYYGKEEDRFDTSTPDQNDTKGKDTKGKKTSNGSTPPDPKKYDYRDHMRSVQDLINDPPPPIQYVVEDMIARGSCSLLIGKPKSRKTTIMLQIATAMAGNPKMLDGWAHFKKIARGGRAVFIDLEQNERIFFEQLIRMGTKEVSANFMRITAFPKLDEDGVAILRNMIVKEKFSFIIIDSLIRIKPDPKRGGSVFADDAQTMQRITNLAHELNVHIMIIAHAGKRNADNDPMEMIAGTNGLTASVDDVFVWFTPDDGDSGGMKRRNLYMSGRNIRRPGTFVFQKRDTDPLFTMMGAEDFFVTGQLRRHIVGLLGGGATMSLKQLTQDTGKNKSNVLRALAGLVKGGLVKRLDDGTYQTKTGAIKQKLDALDKADE